MKSVLIISVMNGASWGGSELLWYQSAFWLRKNNYNIGVCCFYWPEKEEKLNRLKDAGCKLYLLPGKLQAKSLLGKLKLKKMLSSVPLHEYDFVIFNQGGWKDVVHTPFKYLYKKLPPYALSFHNYNARENMTAKRKQILQDWVNQAVANLADTEKVFTVMKEVYSITVPRSGIQINPTTFTPPAGYTDYNSSPDEKTIFSMVAEMDVERKAQDILITALAEKKWKERNWRLNLYGKGEDFTKLEKLIADLGMQNKIFLKGYTQDIKASLTDTHVLLHMTHLDAMPVVVVDAMSVSRPVAVSHVGDMPLWIKEGVNGWLTGKVTSESISETLERAWNEKNRWMQMGRKSFDLFKEKTPADPVKHFIKLCGIIKNENTLHD
jgi:glycosyltransferase involved in cell wall biosynthesis